MIYARLTVNPVDAAPASCSSAVVQPESSRSAIVGSVRLELALGLLVLGSRLLVVSYSGSPLPFYDQWLAEYHNTFIQILTNVGLVDVALVNHNEHFILTTRLVSLMGFLLNGYWDVPFLVVMSALVRAAVAVLTFRLVTAGGSGRQRIAAWIACIALFAVPYSGYNVLSGLQLSFYLVELALVWSISLVLRWRTPLASGLGLVVATIFGLCSMGSAIALPAATLTVHLASRNRRPGFWPAWIGSVAVTLLYIAIIRIKGSADAVASFELTPVLFLLRLMSWPLQLAWVGAIMAGVLVVMMVRLLKARHPTTLSVAALAGLGAFAAVNIIVLSVRREPADFHMRHWEVVAWMPFTFFLALKAVFPGATIVRPHIASIVGAVLAVGLATVFVTRTVPYLEETHRYRDEALQFYRDAFLSGSIREEGYRLNGMLYRQDYSFFDDPILRYMPHPLTVEVIAEAPKPTLALLAPEILPIRSPSLPAKVTHWVCNKGWILCFTFAAVFVALRVRRTKDVASNLPDAETLEATDTASP